MESEGGNQISGVSPTHVFKKKELFLGLVFGEGPLEAHQSPGKIQNHRSLLDLDPEKHMLLLQLPW